MPDNVNNVLCIGELLIDFICSDIGVSIQEGVNFTKKAGGAPANVTACISKLGGSSCFAGKVGDDPFGTFLKKTLDDVNVDTSMLLFDKAHSTTFAFVSLKANGERDFVFDRGADAFLTFDELDMTKIKSSKIIHFGSATALLGGPTMDTYIKAMKIAKQEGKFISFDPNYRVDLWKGNLDAFIYEATKCIKYADFVKVSDDELRIITKKESLEDGVNTLHILGAKIVAVTLGENGTFISNRKETATIPSIKIKSIDSTGAGDAFVGSVLYKISLLSQPKKLVYDFNKIKEITYFANKVGAIVCTKLGAISSLPNIKEVDEYQVVSE